MCKKVEMVVFKLMGKFNVLFREVQACYIVFFIGQVMGIVAFVVSQVKYLVVGWWIECFKEMVNKVFCFGFILIFIQDVVVGGIKLFCELFFFDYFN